MKMDNVELMVEGIVSVYEDDVLIAPPTSNHIHPINFALVVGRCLANMSNGNVYTMAFGNGGHNSLNEIQPASVTKWNDTLYNEVYSEVIDATSGLLGSGVGSVPDHDSPFELFQSGPGCKIVEHVDSTSVIFTCMINRHEPRGQLDYVVDSSLPSSNYFAFDEIGLFSNGLSIIGTNGYQDVDIGNVNVNTAPGLNSNVQYSFQIVVSGRSYNITFTTPNNQSSDITMSDITNQINTVFANNSVPATVLVTDFTTPTPTNTYGYLRFMDTTVGATSSILIKPSTASNPPPYLITALAGTLLQPVKGNSAGTRLSPTNPSTEARRMITHMVLNNKIQKASNKSYKIVYEIKIRAVNL